MIAVNSRGDLAARSISPIKAATVLTHPSRLATGAIALNLWAASKRSRICEIKLRLRGSVSRSMGTRGDSRWPSGSTAVENSLQQSDQCAGRGNNHSLPHAVLNQLRIVLQRSAIKCFAGKKEQHKLRSGLNGLPIRFSAKSYDVRA